LSNFLGSVQSTKDSSFFFFCGKVCLFLQRNAVGKKEGATAFDRFCREKVLYFIKK